MRLRAARRYLPRAGSLALQSDHQAECHSLLLGRSGDPLGFSHEDVIDFDFGAHASDFLVHV
jgi:hypothetical protein